MPETWRVIVAGDRKHPEWGQAIAQLRELCVMSGYRIEHDPLIESDGEKGRCFWDNYRQEHSGEPDPRPSGLEDIELMKVELENDRLQRQPVVVEDLRAVPPVLHAGTDDPRRVQEDLEGSPGPPPRSRTPGDMTAVPALLIIKPGPLRSRSPVFSFGLERKEEARPGYSVPGRASSRCPSSSSSRPG
jgi:hypothetical protein